jgi:hypothetical protein
MSKAIVLAAIGMWGSVSILTASPPAGGARECDFPHAGLVVMVPGGFERQVPSEVYDVLRAVKSEKGQAALAISVAAYPVEEKYTAETFADAQSLVLQATLAIKDLKVVSMSPAVLGSLSGTARVITYTFRGTATAAIQAFFIREAQKPKYRLCYQITVEAGADEQNRIRQVHEDLLKGVRLTGLQHPLEMPISQPVGTFESQGEGFSVRVPEGWFAVSSLAGARLGQTDYLAGGAPAFWLDVVGTDVASDSNSKALSRRCIETYTKAAVGRNNTVKVLSEGPAGLGGAEGYQFVLQETAPRSSMPAEGEPATALKVQRIVCVPGAQGLARNYALILSCRGLEPTKGETMVEKVASGFKILTAASGPATTRPTSTTGTGRP